MASPSYNAQRSSACTRWTMLVSAGPDSPTTTICGHTFARSITSTTCRAVHHPPRLVSGKVKVWFREHISSSCKLLTTSYSVLYSIDGRRRLQRQDCASTESTLEFHSTRPFERQRRHQAAKDCTYTCAARVVNSVGNQQWTCCSEASQQREPFVFSDSR